MSHPRNLRSKWDEFFVPQQDYDARGWRERWNTATRFVHNSQAADRLRALIRTIRPDVAHLHNIYHQITPAILDVLRAYDVPTVMTLHDYKLICPNYSLFTAGAYCYRCRGGRFYHATLQRCGRGTFAGGALLTFEAYWQRARGAYNGVFRFVAPSRSLRDRFIDAGFPGRRVVYVPPFIPRREMLRDAGACAGGKTPETRTGDYVVYAGRLSAEKGVETLIEAIARVDDLELIVCGEGPLRGRLEERARTCARGRVHFTGHLERGALEAIVRDSCASVLPTRSPENAPYAVLEASAAGVPVIVSNMGGLPEMARVVAGSIFENGNVDDLVRKLTEVVGNPRRERARVAAAREQALAYFGERRHIDAVESIYAGAVEARR